MRFKEFIKITEEGQMGGGDNGLMGFPVASSVKKPSDGQPFKNLSPTAGQTPRGNSGGTGTNFGLNMMKKPMKKN